MVEIKSTSEKSHKDSMQKPTKNTEKNNGEDKKSSLKKPAQSLCMSKGAQEKYEGGGVGIPRSKEGSQKNKEGCQRKQKQKQ